MRKRIISFQEQLPITQNSWPFPLKGITFEINKNQIIWHFPEGVNLKGLEDELKSFVYALHPNGFLLICRNEQDFQEYFQKNKYNPIIKSGKVMATILASQSESNAKIVIHKNKLIFQPQAKAKAVFGKLFPFVSEDLHIPEIRDKYMVIVKEPTPPVGHPS